mgnify:FL=1
MKKILMILAAASTLALASCEDWLDKYPLSAGSPETFFKTATDLEAYSNQFYADILPGTSVYEECADNIVKDVLLNEMTDGRIVPNSGGGWSWGALRDINTMIEYSVNCEDEAARKEYVALARFFRAYFYFEKVKRFGDVPWYDKPIAASDTEQLNKPRDSRELVMTNIIADLDDAIANLPTKKEVYKVTKWTALALKSRVCLFEGTFRKYHGLSDYEKYLNGAVSAAEEFMSKSGYKLYSTGNPDVDYRDLFASVEAIGDEIILARDYTNEYGSYHNATLYGLNTSYGKPGMSRKIVDTYLMADGSRFTDKPGYETMEFAEQVSGRDPRLAQTMRTPGFKRIDSDVTEPLRLNFSVTGYQITKYVHSINAGADTYGRSYNDLPLFRTAEVYLNFAEAKAELGTLTQADIDKSIKLIRDRVAMPNLDVAAANANPDPYLDNNKTGYVNVKGDMKGVILEIRRERTIELMDENFRYYDIIRWKEGQCFLQDLVGIYITGSGPQDFDKDGKIDAYLKAADEGQAPAEYDKIDQFTIGKEIRLSEGDHGFITPYSEGYQQWNEARDYFYPIPTDDIQLTNGALVQNPGWE